MEAAQKGRLGRFALVLVVGALAGCVAVVTEPHAAGPPPRWQWPYAGRIVLVAPSLPTTVGAFEQAWWHRLALLGVSARIAYDDQHAIIDVYGTHAGRLANVAGALVDPGGWSLRGHSLSAAYVDEWLPATEICACGGQLRLMLPASVACELGSGPGGIARPGSAPFPVELRVRWLTSERQLDSKCPVDQRPEVTVLLPAGLTSDTALAMALALGGQDVPEVPRVESITPAAGNPR